jgi:nicotinate-nucleotide adenylyltransferase
MPETSERIGIIGGSFNPIHIAHLIIADRFVDQMGLDICYFVPAYQSPFKKEDSSLASPEDRIDMVRKATQQHPRFRVSDVELQRGGISYTLDTVMHFRGVHEHAAVSLLVGSDQAVEFVRWHHWQEICQHAQLCIVRRPFLLTPEMEERISDQLTVNGRPPVWIGAPLLEISSTDIRRRVHEEKSINYLTVKAVRDHIAERSLYR